MEKKKKASAPASIFPVMTKEKQDVNWRKNRVHLTEIIRKRAAVRIYEENRLCGICGGCLSIYNSKDVCFCHQEEIHFYERKINNPLSREED